jgi:hypothetical protein
MISNNYKIFDTLRGKHTRSNRGLDYILCIARKEIYKDKARNKSSEMYRLEKKRKKRLSKIHYKDHRKKCLLENKIWTLLNPAKSSFIKKKSYLKKKYRLAMIEVYKHNRVVKRIKDQILKLQLTLKGNKNER